MVQTGGLAGTFIGPDKLDTPLDYDSMKTMVSALAQVLYLQLMIHIVLWISL